MGTQISPIARAILMGRECLDIPTTLWHKLRKNRWTDRDAVWVMDSGPVGPRKHVLDAEPDPMWGVIFRERTCTDMPDDFLTWAVQNWLNRSRCRLGCGRWAEESMCYMGAHRLIVAKTEASVFCGDVALCHITLTTYYLTKWHYFWSSESTLQHPFPFLTWFCLWHLKETLSVLIFPLQCISI